MYLVTMIYHRLMWHILSGLQRHPLKKKCKPLQTHHVSRNMSVINVYEV
jgi:hypothetical protein